MISGLPIGWQTPVRFFALMKSPYKEENDRVVCNILDLWVPLHVPIKAKYNDYGSVDDLEDSPVTDNFFKVLDLLAVEREGDMVYPAVVKGMSHEDWLSALWMMVVRVVKAHRLIVQPWVEEVLKLDKDLPLEEFLKAYNAIKEANPERTVQGMVGRGPWKETYQVAWAMIREDVWQAMLELSPDSEVYYSDTYLSLYPTHGLCPEGFEDERAEYLRVCNLMDRLSRIWIPGHTVGPQFPEWEIPNKFAQAMAKITDTQYLIQENPDGEEGDDPE